MTPEDDFAAAEFALGTLSPGERAALAARRLREPDLDTAIHAWEESLAPLAEAVPAVEPAVNHLPAIEARIRAGSPPVAVPADGAAVALRRSLARWRAAAIAASCVAALLAVGFGLREATRAAPPREYVAILQKDANSPAFEVTVNLDREELTVYPVAAHAPPGKSYELWITEASLGAPRPLGVIGEGGRAANLTAYDRAVVEKATYAVTLEPPGGSPDGRPSGSPVFSGKLIPVEP